MPTTLTAHDTGSHGLAAPGPARGSALQLWQMLVQHRRTLVVAVGLGVAAGAAAWWLSPPRYEASVSLRVDQKRSGVAVLDVLSNMSDEGSELSTEMQMLRTRRLAESTVQRLGLQLDVREPRTMLGVTIPTASRVVPRAEALGVAVVTDPDARGRYLLERQRDFSFVVRDDDSGDSVTTAVVGRPFRVPGAELALRPEMVKRERLLLEVVPFEGAVGAMRKDLSVTRPNREANFVSIRYESEDRGLAAAVPNVLAEEFLALRNDLQKTEARSTAAFLRGRIDTLATQLAGTEDALRNFREGNRVVSLTDEATTQVGELAKLQADRDTKEAERKALARALADAEATQAANPDGPSPYRALVAFPTLISTNAAQFLQNLDAAENARAELLRRRKPTDPEVQVLTGRIREQETQLRTIARTYLAGLTSQVASMDATLARFQSQLRQIPSKELQLARLQRQNSVLVDVYKMLQTRLQEAQIAQAVDDSRVRIMDAALVPRLPFAPNRRRYLALGLLMGALAGGALIFLREALDRTVHTPEDLEQLTGVTGLGLIPRIPGVAAQEAAVAVAHGPATTRMGRTVLQDARSPVAEAYRTLRTNLAFARPGRPARTLVFSSPTAGDGKTTTTANLATVLAHQGQRVLLIDADMRRGTLDQVFGIPRSPGFSNVLVGAATVGECVRRVALEGSSGQLDVLPSGAFPPNPSELIASPRLASLLAELGAVYDVVIFDSPPLNLVTDAAILGASADGVVLVARAGATDKGAVVYASELLRKVHAPFFGTVLNEFDLRRDARHATYGGYGYYASRYGDYGEPPTSNGNGNGSGNGRDAGAHAVGRAAAAPAQRLRLRIEAVGRKLIGRT